jgi:hypothetical protein
VSKLPDGFEWDGHVLWVTCIECGNQQADMGFNVACEECGFTMPSGQFYLDERGRLKPEYLESQSEKA